MTLKRLAPILLLIILPAIVYIAYLRPEKQDIECDTNSSLTTIQLKGNGTALTAEVADDNAARVQGLSNRNCIDASKAMLFRYDLPGDYCFWMKDMNFPIDMIWLNDEKQIVSVQDNVQPDTYPQTFCPDKPAQYIVEVAAGRAGELGWQVGAQLSF